MQDEILKKHPSANIRAYVVWQPWMPTDRREAWDPSIISDPRTIHYWDADLVASKWSAKMPGNDQGVEWDILYAFGPDAKWENTPAPLVSVGATIYHERDKLSREIEPLLKQ